MTGQRKRHSAPDEQLVQQGESIAQFERDGIAWEFIYDTVIDDLVPVPKEDAEPDGGDDLLVF